jgi:hypothetical protein
VAQCLNQLRHHIPHRTEIFDEVSEHHFPDVRSIRMYRVYSTRLHGTLPIRPHIELVMKLVAWEKLCPKFVLQILQDSTASASLRMSIRLNAVKFCCLLFSVYYQ